MPEIASRYHVEFIGHCLNRALKEAEIDFRDIKLVSATQGPGLASSLLVGISMAKAMSFALDVPIIGVNHLIAHIWAAFLTEKTEKVPGTFSQISGRKCLALSASSNVRFPFVGFIVSGGHTNLIYFKSVTDFEPLGQTRDDACGESFDKVAKILKLGYPGGPVIEKRARRGHRSKINFPRSYLNGSLDFSFSGIKTSVLYYVKKNGKKRLGGSFVDDVAASFQEAVLDVLVSKAISACRKKNCRSLIVGGGVSANQRLRKKLFKEAKKYNIRVYFPPLEFCLDNAAMTACLGGELFAAGQRSELDLQAYQYNTF